ncbi:MAG: amidohydrolase family protein [Gemmatimonadota bacterium]|nr:amidohydrolase family protein [Gemmatimonadota bacterium]
MSVQTPARACAASLAALCLLGLTPSSGSLGDPPPESGFEVTIREGTNMAAALSPDGSTLAIDALGRIWTLPAGGGEARALTDPFGDARQPTWSPDGSTIAFQAYWGGDYDIWLVSADGEGLRRLTNGPFDDREPHWSPDGTRIAFSSDRGGTYDIWEVTVGDREVRRLTTDGDNEYAPAFGPDGRVAYVTDGSEAGLWVRSASGAVEQVVDLGDVEGFGPTWSPDGARIAYSTQTYGASALHVVAVSDAEGMGSRISDADEDVFPFRASWRADGHLVYTADGKLRSRPAAGGAASEVAFAATVTVNRPTYRKALRDLDASGPTPVRGIVSPALSPDGAQVAFTALGDLWLMPIGGEPRRLTDDPWAEIDAAWSPDGESLAFATDRGGTMEVWVHDVSTGEARQLTRDGGGSPSWSPDGREIAYIGGDGSEAGLRVVSVATGSTVTVRSGLFRPGRPTWSPDGRRIAASALSPYSTRYREGVNKALLMRVPRPATEDSDTDPFDTWATPLQADERWLDFLPHGSVGTRSSDGPIWSPDGDWLAYVSNGVLWVIPVTHDGDPVGPPRRLNNEATAYLSWAGDSRSLVYLSTHGLRRAWLESGDIDDVPVPLSWRRTVPADRTVLHAGALFDGVSEELARNVDVVIEGNRIVRVGPHDAGLHRGRVVDVSDGVVSPGLIEMHTHGGLGEGEAIGRQWLSYGVTTIRRVSADPYDMTEAKESVESGRRIGPRVFGTGSSMDGSRIYYSGGASMGAIAQVELEMQRAAALEYDLIKTYVRLPDAVQRRVIEDAHALGMSVTSHELYPGVAYGADGVEHVRGTSRRGYSTKVTELNRSYQDVVELLARSRMAITPTVGLYGGFGLLAADDPALLADARLEAFGGSTARGRRGGDPEVVRRMVRDMGSLARRVVEQGGVVVVGTDFGPAGLSLVAEMEVLVRYGGMDPIDVMRATTSVPAEAMGYGGDLGIVREGMLADLVVFGENPLEDISAARDVRWVVANGRVFSMVELLERPMGG